MRGGNDEDEEDPTYLSLSCTPLLSVAAADSLAPSHATRHFLTRKRLPPRTWSEYLSMMIIPAASDDDDDDDEADDDDDDALRAEPGPEPEPRPVPGRRPEPEPNS